MSSGTAYYNLRKDASTDNYNVSVVNQNLDDIDAQMHQNEVAATTPFTGATSSVNGEKGIVPRPLVGDQEKYLKGDGTWDTPQGGGGGSTVTITPTLSSGTKIADYSIDGVSGSLYAPSGGGGGGSHTYSTTEQIVGTWIDGRSIFEKVFYIENGINISNSWSALPSSITSELSNVSVFINGFATRETSGSVYTGCVPLNIWYRTGTEVVVNTSETFNNMKYICLQYVKGGE